MTYEEILQRTKQAGKELVMPVLHWANQLYQIKKDAQQKRIHDIELEKRQHAAQAADALTSALIRHNTHLSPTALGVPYMAQIEAMSEKNQMQLEHKHHDE